MTYRNVNYGKEYGNDSTQVWLFNTLTSMGVTTIVPPVFFFPWATQDKKIQWTAKK